MLLCEIAKTNMNNRYHYPVMYNQVLELLKLSNKKNLVDCTVGIGSHAYKLLENAAQEAFLVGIDKDQNSLQIAAQTLNVFKDKAILIKENFCNLEKILADLRIEGVDAFLFDLGISTYQLNDSERGFSFLKEGPLDMRMDRDSFLCAYDLVNNLSETELGNIFNKFGQERYYRKIAHYLIETRRLTPIATTSQLVRAIMHSSPYRSQGQRIHPATRIFQSLRIAVNRELEALTCGLKQAITYLNKNGRIAVISFHSLEDRIVKHVFRDYAYQGILKLITKKPLLPTDLETAENPSSRSAKLRVAEKINDL